jgi:hypothetical protein
MFGRLGTISYFISLIFIAIPYLGISVFNFSNLSFGLFIIFGLLGFLLNILAIYFDPKNIKSNKNAGFLYYVGIGAIYIGLIFRYMHWPFSLIILTGGALLVGISFLIPKKSSNSSSELLDS